MRKYLDDRDNWQRAFAIATWNNMKMKSSEIARKFGVHRETVRKALDLLGENNSRSEGSTLYSINHNAFSELTDESAYWCGVVMSDGNVYQQRNEWQPLISLVASIEDLEWGIKFKKFLQSNNPIGYKPAQSETRSPSFVFQPRSSQIAADLAHLGIVPNKSLTAVAHDDLAKNINFWRGIIDGDGNVKSKEGNGFRWRIRIEIGSKALLEQFQQFVLENFGIYRPITEYSSTKKNGEISTAYRYCLGITQGALEALEAMYGNVNPMFAMYRKHSDVIELLHRHGLTQYQFPELPYFTQDDVIGKTLHEELLETLPENSIGNLRNWYQKIGYRFD